MELFTVLYVCYLFCSFFISGPDKTDTYAQPPWYVFTGVLSQNI